ncbi:MAG: hypothetical protein Q4G62_11195 [Pseudomonadota bacterium]|nr:hypothetical protein [Pseudomonadota bacterium]
MPHGVNTVGYSTRGNAMPAGSYQLLSLPQRLWVPVEPGQTYIASAYLAAHGCDVTVSIRWADENFTPASHPGGWHEVMSGFSRANGGRNIANWPRRHVAAVAPATARWAAVDFWMRGSGEGWASIWACQPMLERASPGQTEPSPYAPSAAEAGAAHTVALNVDGHISGTQSTNDGKRSVFSVLASVFRVISNAVSGVGMEWLDSYLRIYTSGAQLVLGHDFGSGNIVMWYGPNVGANAATKTNGLFWLDKFGDGYFGGILRSGTLHTAERRNYSTLIPGANSRHEVLHRRSIGRTKSITVSATWLDNSSVNAPTRADAMSFINARKPDRTGTVTWRLLRGAEVIWQQSVTSTSGTTEPEFIDTVPPVWHATATHAFSASATISDTYSGTGDIPYRIEVVSSSGQFFANHGVLAISVVEQ